MVHSPLESMRQGLDWHIHISSSPMQDSDRNIKMDEIQKAVELATKMARGDPPWATKPSAPTQDVDKTSQRAIDIYMLSKKPNGGMGGIGWWQSANGYTAMALHDVWSSNHGNAPRNYDILARIIRQCDSNHPGLINAFNDDTLWWAMLCMHMYAIKRDDWFLKKAEAIWEHVRKSVCGRGEVSFNGNDMEGAVFWTTRPGEEQINAITSGLFAELSMRLALLKTNGDQIREPSSKSNQPTRAEYIEAARCSLGWVLRCRYRPRRGIVLDHIKLKKNKAVDWIFTYNTGVALGVCALLYEATREEEYMTLACHMAYKAMTFTGPQGWIEDDGVLTEKGAYGRGTHDPWKNNDSVGFKAVLVRQLCTLYDVISRIGCQQPYALHVKDIIKEFINVNFRSQQERNTNRKGQYGPWWGGPFQCPTSHSQMAALDVMAAAVLVNP